MGTRIAVIGGGLLGCTTALLLARAGHDVDLIDRRDTLLDGASRWNEGKVHLGAVYALGDERTWRTMVDGALDFGEVLEDAVGHPIDWAALRTAPFDHVVLPSSLASPTQLADAYAAINRCFAEAVEAREGGTYLGLDARSVVDPDWHVCPVTGNPRFSTEERAVDPEALRAIVVDAIESEPRIAVRLGETIEAVDVRRRSVRVADVGEYDVAVNCAWEGRAAIKRSAGIAVPADRNYRIKLAMRLRTVAAADCVTFVHGPFGDVAVHGAYTFASWYPIGRVWRETGAVPTSGFQETLDAPDERWHDVAAQQVQALRDLGALQEDPEVLAVRAGAIIASGEGDVDERDSPLHRRSGCEPAVHGRLVTPENWKFSTAPRAARLAVQAVDAICAGAACTTSP